MTAQELHDRGFKALVNELGWVDAVRFIQLFERSTHNDTEERHSFLPDWDAETMIRKVKELQVRWAENEQ